MSERLQKLSKMQDELTYGWVEYWKEFVWGAWQFWFLVAVTILTLMIWWKLVDRSRFIQIVLYGGLMHSLSIYLDAFGTQLTLWEYKYQVTPVIPTALSLNASIIPVTFMLIYQYSSTWKRYFILMVSFAVIAAYPMQYFLRMINYYDDENWWNSHWSLLTLIFMGTFIKFLVDQIVNVQKRT